MENRSNEYFPTLTSAIFKQIEVIERYDANSAMMEACETIAGVMAEQSELFTRIETSNDTELKKWLEKRGEKECIYSAHFLAIRDALRLAKLVKELIELKNDFIEDGGEEWLNTIVCKRFTSDKTV